MLWVTVIQVYMKKCFLFPLKMLHFSSWPIFVVQPERKWISSFHLLTSVPCRCLIDSTRATAIFYPSSEGKAMQLHIQASYLGGWVQWCARTGSYWLLNLQELCEPFENRAEPDTWCADQLFHGMAGGAMESAKPVLKHWLGSYNTLD